MSRCHLWHEGRKNEAQNQEQWKCHQPSLSDRKSSHKSQFKSALGAQLANNSDFKGIKKYKSNCRHVWSEHYHGDSYISSRIYHRIKASVWLFSYF